MPGRGKREEWSGNRRYSTCPYIRCFSINYNYIHVLLPVIPPSFLYPLPHSSSALPPPPPPFSSPYLSSPLSLICLTVFSLGRGYVEVQYASCFTYENSQEDIVHYIRNLFTFINLAMSSLSVLYYIPWYILYQLYICELIIMSAHALLCIVGAIS